MIWSTTTWERLHCCHGAILAEEIEPTNIFQAQFKPCLVTMERLTSDASTRNGLSWALTKSSEDRALDERLLAETREELECSWAEGAKRKHGRVKRVLGSLYFFLPWRQLVCEKGLRWNRHEIYTATCQSLQPTFYTEVKRVVLHGENCHPP